ncbi:MAG: hypothetical protein RH917_13115 [Lacipirellulaceae bacterium]
MNRRQASFSYRFVISCLLGVLLSQATIAWGQQHFPYVAFVSGANAFVRSGPSERHYPTSSLTSGAAVEVFRHDADGWCAVRPPHNAFSLVPKQSLRIIDERTAEVIVDDAVARVGSQLSPQKQAVQVMLKKGERVQLLRSTLPVVGQQPGNDWVRIAPPAGEFRWVAAKDLSLDPPLEPNPPTPTVPSTQPSTSSPKMIWQSYGSAIPSAPPSPVQSENANSGGNAFAHLRHQTISATNLEPIATDSMHSIEMHQADDETVRIVEGSPAELQLAQYAQKSDSKEKITAPPLYPTRNSNPASDILADKKPLPAVFDTPKRVDYDGRMPPRIKFRDEASTLPENKRIAELQMRLSREVIQPPKQWNLIALREETAVLLANEQAPGAREQYRELLNRIATFEQVQARYQQPVLAPAAVTKAIEPAAVEAKPMPELGQLATEEVELPEVALPEVALTEEIAASGTSGQSPAHTPGSAAVLDRIREDLGGRAAKPRAAELVQNHRTLTPVQVDPFESTGNQLSANGTEEAKYDAVGILKPVVSKRAKAPRYALVDQKGEVVSFVTPTPDVNLQRYVGRRVGIQGKRGYMPDYKRAHVTASRVNMLGGTQRR